MSFTFDIKQITGGDTAQLDTLFKVAAAPAAPAALRANTAEKLFQYLFKGEQLDAALAPQLASLQKAFITLVSQHDNFYSDNAYPLRKVFACLLGRVRTWYPRDSKPNQLYYEKVTALINATLHWAIPTNSSKTTEINKLIEILTDFNQWADAEERRANMLETRLCEAEIINLKMLTAECRVLDLINESLAAKSLPLEILNEIPTILKSELQHCVFTTGVDSNFWKIWQRLLPMLGRVFDDTVAVDEQQLYRDIPAMLNELERTLKISTGNPDRYREFVEILSQVLMRSIQKQAQKTQPLEPLVYPEGHSDLSTRVTDAVLQQTANIQQGDWILFAAENDKLIRCKLALKNTDTDQLLFVDNTGRKVMIKSSKDFSLCISTGIAKPLPVIKLDEAITKLVSALIELSQQKSAQLHAQVEAQQQADLKNQEQRKNEHIKAEQDKAKAIEEAQEKEAAIRRAAAQKAMAEAKALAAEKARRDNTTAENSKKAEPAELPIVQQNEPAEIIVDKNQRQLLAIAEIGALNVGAWIEVINAQQETVRCKLAVMIASAGKYIFVDNLGRKVAEYQRDQLIQAYVDNNLTLINKGDRFEDQLVKVIRSLRKDIS